MKSTPQKPRKRKKRDYRRIIMSVMCLLLVFAMLGSLVLSALV